jgi:hypothetical protein
MDFTMLAPVRSGRDFEVAAGGTVLILAEGISRPGRTAARVDAAELPSLGAKDVAVPRGSPGARALVVAGLYLTRHRPYEGGN